jgi:hypothetical protein
MVNLVLVMMGALAAEQEPRETADLLFLGNIVTLDGSRPRTGALAIPSEKLAGLRVLMTVVGGRVVSLTR